MSWSDPFRTFVRSGLGAALTRLFGEAPIPAPSYAMAVESLQPIQLTDRIWRDAAVETHLQGLLAKLSDRLHLLSLAAASMHYA